jgi:hypothetical protein
VQWHSALPDLYVSDKALRHADIVDLTIDGVAARHRTVGLAYPKGFTARPG